LYFLGNTKKILLSLSSQKKFCFKFNVKEHAQISAEFKKIVAILKRETSPLALHFPSHLILVDLLENSFLNSPKFTLTENQQLFLLNDSPAVGHEWLLMGCLVNSDDVATRTRMRIGKKLTVLPHEAMSLEDGAVCSTDKLDDNIFFANNIFFYCDQVEEGDSKAHIEIDFPIARCIKKIDFNVPVVVCINGNSFGDFEKLKRLRHLGTFCDVIRFLRQVNQDMIVVLREKYGVVDADESEYFSEDDSNSVVDVDDSTNSATKNSVDGDDSTCSAKEVFNVMLARQKALSLVFSVIENSNKTLGKIVDSSNYPDTSTKSVMARQIVHNVLYFLDPRSALVDLDFCRMHWMANCEKSQKYNLYGEKAVMYPCIILGLESVHKKFIENVDSSRILQFKKKLAEFMVCSEMNKTMYIPGLKALKFYSMFGSDGQYLWPMPSLDKLEVIANDNEEEEEEEEEEEVEENEKEDDSDEDSLKKSNNLLKEFNDEEWELERERKGIENLKRSVIGSSYVKNNPPLKKTSVLTVEKFLGKPDSGGSTYLEKYSRVASALWTEMQDLAKVTQGKPSAFSKKEAQALLNKFSGDFDSVLLEWDERLLVILDRIYFLHRGMISDEILKAFNEEQDMLVKILRNSGRFDAKKFNDSRDRGAYHKARTDNKRRFDVIYPPSEENKGLSKLDIIAKNRSDQLEKEKLLKKKKEADDKLKRERDKRFERIDRLMNGGRDEYLAAWDASAAAAGSDDNVNTSATAAITTPPITHVKESDAEVVPVANSDEEVAPTFVAVVTPITNSRRITRSATVEK
jgi:hypothetical protein